MVFQSVLKYMIFILALGVSSTHCFKIGAFNIQVFGQSKIEKPGVLEALGKILRRYDVVLIQEIRDTEGTAIDTLLDQVNQNSDVNYTYIISERLGRTTSKEQYAYMYKDDDSIEVLDKYTYNDGDESLSQDTFEREPFMAKFNFKYTAIGTVVLGGVHIKPQEAFAEINQLKQVFDDIHSRWNIDDIIMMGDMNADCSYLSNTKYSQLTLVQDQNFYWPIDKDADTTVATSGCAYDRFIITGDHLISNIVNGSVGVFRFDTEYGYTQDKTKLISDHYPIEISLIDDFPDANPLADGEVRIGAFDVSSFGQTKANNPDVLTAIAKIIRRYTVMFLQGIRDSQGSAFQTLMTEVNKDQTQNYVSILSERVGRRSTTKEQYAIIYKNTSTIEITQNYIFDDSVMDSFERDPMVVRFRLRNSGIPDFSFIGVHVKSEDAFVELSALNEVHTSVQTQTGSDEIVVMGNMFADCSYVAQSRLQELAIRGNDFMWPIGDTADTTTGNSDCAYDRIVLSGSLLRQHMISSKTGVFNFQSFYRYDDVFANDIGEHYPVEVVFTASSMETSSTGTSSTGSDELTLTTTGSSGPSSVGAQLCSSVFFILEVTIATTCLFI